jgi:CRISPR/Cas system-associated exonuclease Cas4 (RecB family)
MSKDGRIWLSHTSIEVLARCPRCFWLQVNKGIRQPEGIVSRLANRFDIVIKNYFDKYRNSGVMPPMVEGKLPGIIQNPFQEKYFARINSKYGFFGKLDECLENEAGELSPVDFKTSSSDPREKEILSAYQSQIDDYIFLIKENGKQTTGEGFLIYFYPDFGEELHNGFPMIVHIEKLKGDPERTKSRIENAIKVLEGSMPASSPECPFCNYRQEIENIGN